MTSAAELGWRLRSILKELQQATCQVDDPRDRDKILGWLDQYHEWVDADEPAIAYESIVTLLETRVISLSSKAAVRLLEVGLWMQYKTDRPCDKIFDRRTSSHGG